jgi:hypothetical protein
VCYALEIHIQKEQTQPNVQLAQQIHLQMLETQIVLVISDMQVPIQQEHLLLSDVQVVQVVVQSVQLELIPLLQVRHLEQFQPLPALHALPEPFHQLLELPPVRHAVQENIQIQEQQLAHLAVHLVPHVQLRRPLAPVVLEVNSFTQVRATLPVLPEFMDQPLLKLVFKFAHLDISPILPLKPVFKFAHLDISLILLLKLVLPPVLQLTSALIKFVNLAVLDVLFAPAQPFVLLVLVLTLFPQLNLAEMLGVVWTA